MTQSRIELITQRFYSRTDDVAEFPVTAAEFKNLVGQIEGGHDCHAVETDDFAAITDVAHASIQELGGGGEISFFGGRARNLIFLLQYANADLGLTVAHVSESLGAVLHGLQPLDHRLDAAAYHVVLLQQAGLLGDQHVLALAQRAVLFPELVADANELINAFLDAL